MEGQFKTIAIGSDHAAIEERKLLIKELESWGIKVIDMGPDAPKPPVQFSLIAEKVALEVVNDKTGETGGILMCGNGVGMSVAANKVPGARAAVCNELFTAKFAKSDTKLNILTMGARVIAPRMMAEIAKVWIETEYSKEPRFTERLDVMAEMEAKYRTK